MKLMHQEEEDNQQTSKCYHQSSSSSNLHNKDHDEMKLICEEDQDLSSKETSHAMLTHFCLIKIYILVCFFVWLEWNWRRDG